RIGRRLLLPVHADDAGGARELVRHQDVRTRALHDLKREGHVGRARHAGHVALHLGIAEVVPRLVAAYVDLQPIVETRFLFRQRLGLIVNLAALDDALARGPGAVRTNELVVGAGLGVVILQIPVRRNHRLPDAVEVGVPVGRARRAIGGGKLWSGARTL